MAILLDVDQVRFEIVLFVQRSHFPLGQNSV
jgi:hypothetical protein